MFIRKRKLIRHFEAEIEELTCHAEMWETREELAMAEGDDRAEVYHLNKVSCEGAISELRRQIAIIKGIYYVPLKG